METRLDTDRTRDLDPPPLYTEARPPYGRPVPAETGAQARQGPLGRPVLYVLVGGLLLAIVYLVATQIWSASEDLPPVDQIQNEPADVVAPAPINIAPAPVTPTPAPLDVIPAPITPTP